MIGMFDASDIEGIERTIQMAIAPAFLLTAVLAALNVLTQRLARIVDRDRAIDDGLTRSQPNERTLLAARARWAHRAIGACVVTAILLCLLIIVAFVGVVLELLAAFVVAGLLMTAMGSLVVALLCFMMEVRLATWNLPIDDDPGAGRHG